MDKISIIIPVFNSEPFLGKCIDSIVFQSFKNIEILAIDDASTDCSKKILNDYARSDRRLRVYYHDKNKGAPSARNLGIQKATGDYIMFVDADDELRKDALSSLYKYADLYGTDCVKGTLTYKYKNISYTWKNNRRPYPKALIPQINFQDCLMLWHLKEYQTYIFKKELITRNGCNFNESLYACQDIPFLAQALSASKKITLIPDNVYIHRNHGNSIVNSNWGFNQYKSLIEGYALTTDVLINHEYHKIAEYFCSSLVEYWNKFLKMPQLLTEQECFCVFHLIQKLYEQIKKPLWKENSIIWETAFLSLIIGGFNYQALLLLKKQSSTLKRIRRIALKLYKR